MSGRAHAERIDGTSQYHCLYMRIVESTLYSADKWLWFTVPAHAVHAQSSRRRYVDRHSALSLTIKQGRNKAGVCSHVHVKTFSWVKGLLQARRIGEYRNTHTHNSSLLTAFSPDMYFLLKRPQRDAPYLPRARAPSCRDWPPLSVSRRYDGGVDALRTCSAELPSPLLCACRGGGNLAAAFSPGITCSTDPGPPKLLELVLSLVSVSEGFIDPTCYVHQGTCLGMLVPPSSCLPPFRVWRE